MRVFYCLFLAFCLSCSNNDSDIPDTCVSIILDELKFNSTENFGIDLIEFNLDEHCLTVKLGISGCDGNHEVELVNDGRILLSNPPKTSLDFYDPNPQFCEAYFVIEKEYDLSPLLSSQTDEIIISFRNNEGSFTLK